MILRTSLSLLLSSILILLTESQKVALSHITLLLPYTDQYTHSPIQYKISSHGGASNDCVDWTVDPKDRVIKLEKKVSVGHQCPNNLYDEAIIKVISPPSDGRVSATITAKDPKSETFAECEVFIDKVHRLQVATSTRLIYRGKYESIEVQGFDDKGNKFTTLRGLYMKWQGIREHLEEISLNDAKLMLPDYNAAAVKTKNPLPVRGMKTGQENVKVSIDTTRDRAHRGCQPAEASLFVVMQLHLKPRTLYLPRCCVAQLSLETTSHSPMDKNGNLMIDDPSIGFYRHNIHLPDNQYRFSLHDPNNGRAQLKMTVNHEGVVTTSTVQEIGKILVEDKVTSHKAIENTADARVFVKYTDRILAEVIKDPSMEQRPEIYPHREEMDDWYLSINQRYLIRLTLMAKGVNEFMCVKTVHFGKDKQWYLKGWATREMEYICRNIEFKVVVKDQNIKVIDSMDIPDNEFYIIPRKIGEVKLQFTAKSTACSKPSDIMTLVKTVHITEPVMFMNTTTTYCPNSDAMEDDKEQLVLIPFTGQRVQHQAPVFIKGGSGEYLYEISDDAIAQSNGFEVNRNQHLVIKGKKEGQTNLFVIDAKNPDNFAMIKVEVTRIEQWRLSEDVIKEILISNSIEIPLIIRDIKGRRFSGLDGVKDMIDTTVTEDNIALQFESITSKKLIDRFYTSQKMGHKTDAEGDNNDDDEESNGTEIAVKKAIVDKVKQNSEMFRKPTPFTCDASDAVVIVNGLSTGFDRFSIGISNHPVIVRAAMLVSVYKDIQPTHQAVAIAMGITDNYKMEWKYGPQQWPNSNVDDFGITKFDESFLSPLEVSVVRFYPNGTAEPGVSASNTEDFIITYAEQTLTFRCNKAFHYDVELIVQNKKVDSLPHPVHSTANIEVFCFPKFEFTPSTLDMGVGTRRRAEEFYPDWIKSKDAERFEIKLSQKESDIVSIASARNFRAKRLGSAQIKGTLQDSRQQVYIHPVGFTNTLKITVLFKGFSMEMPSHWILSGNEQIAHIEALDESHHILPFQHNFDDVIVEWQSEDPKIIELLPILPTPNTENPSTSDADKNAFGTGLSVKLKAHSTGIVNIKASISLRNPPKKIKSRFELIQSIKVISKVVHSPNSIILKPNCTYSLSQRFNPDINVPGIGPIYDTAYHPERDIIEVKDQTLTVRPEAPSGENVVVAYLLKPRQKQQASGKRPYPLTQAASLIVSIVEPTGLQLLQPATISSNKMQIRSVDYNGRSGAGKKWWMSSSDAAKVAFDTKYSRTDNILCESQNISLKIAILDELARELHVMDPISVVSNDTAIVLPNKDIQVVQDKIGGPQYATVQLNALQPGFATITFRQQEKSSVDTTSATSSDIYLYDNPRSLRTFLTIRVIPSSECESDFGVRFTKEYVVRNQTEVYHQKATPRKRDIDYKNGKNWKAKTAKWLYPTSGNILLGLLMVSVLICIIMCTWGRNSTDVFIGYQAPPPAPPAMWDPYATVDGFHR